MTHTIQSLWTQFVTANSSASFVSYRCLRSFMKTHAFSFCAPLLLVMVFADSALPQTAAFTYQGRLTANGAPVNGLYDFMLAIYDSNNQPGTIIAGPFLQSPIPVTNGL